MSGSEHLLPGNGTGMTFDVEADWMLNLLCNYDCDYCSSRASREHHLVGRLSPQQYLEFFNSTQQTWLLHITGGEPFFYPDFVNLCRALTSRHYLSLNSNLTSRRVCDFAAAIDPSRVRLIHCGVHVEERDRKKGWRGLLDNVTVLLEHGFPVFASLVMTPPAFAHFQRVEEMFRNVGVPLIPKALRGYYERRWYPTAYTAAEHTQFQRFSEQVEAVAKSSQWQPFRHFPTINPFLDRDYLDGFPDFKGIQCSAGRRLVSIALDGSIYRCGQKTLLGNIGEGRLDLLAEDRPCDNQFCLYFCLQYSRFEDQAAANYRRRSEPNALRQTLIKISRLGRDIGTWSALSAKKRDSGAR